jgi:DNA uptake protein ComE-like DNA-binding protein
MAEEQEAHPARTGRVLWPWISLTPLGFGAWAPIYAGVKARRRWWIALGLLWSLLVIAGFAFNWIDGNTGHDGLVGALLIVGWFGSIATSFAIRPAYRRVMDSPLQRAIDAAEVRLTDRSDARRLAREQPELAQQVGIGRPDLPGATDAGLVDVNNAPAAALETLPGVDDAAATAIIEARAAAGGFASLDELGMVADLDGRVVEGLRDYVVFLPRGPRA